MKYSLSSRQSPDYLEKCDEIKVMWNDRDIIYDLIDKYPGKEINLCKYYIHSSDEIDWKEIETFKKLAKDNFIFGVSFIEDMVECINRSIRFYYLEPIRSFREARGLANMGVAYLFIDAPLFFQMSKVKNIGIPVRVTANLSIRELFPYEDGVPGPWIRPEDVELYEPYVDMIEFSRVNMDQERALFRIYAEQHTWSGELGMIIQNLNHLGTNRMISSEITEKRLNCGQRCQADGGCRLCWRALDLANPDAVRHYRDTTE